eukprot:4805303-Amphidinium_carterae.1
MEEFALRSVATAFCTHVEFAICRLTRITTLAIAQILWRRLLVTLRLALPLGVALLALVGAICRAGF